jgi:predicted RNase H-like nuclease (RuvC/YqgF family)
MEYPGKKGKKKFKLFNLPNRNHEEVKLETGAFEKERQRAEMLAKLEAARRRQEEEKAKKAFNSQTFEKHTEKERKKKRRERELMDRVAELREQLNERDELVLNLLARLDNTKRKMRSRGNSSTVTPGNPADPTRQNVNINIAEVENHIRCAEINLVKTPCHHGVLGEKAASTQATLIRLHGRNKTA